MSGADGSAAGGGKQSSFSTPEIPLVFDLPTVGQTPQPRLYCYGPGHGVLLGEIGDRLWGRHPVNWLPWL